MTRTAENVSWRELGTEEDRRVAWLLTALDGHRRQWGQRSGLGVADRRLLWLFADRTPRTLREISEALGLEQSTVNRQVNAALAAGILDRRRERGRAAHVVEATDDGLARFEQEIVESLGLYRGALDALGADAERFVELLERFVDAFGVSVQDETRPPQP